MRRIRLYILLGITMLSAQEMHPEISGYWQSGLVVDLHGPKSTYAKASFEIELENDKYGKAFSKTEIEAESDSTSIDIHELFIQFYWNSLRVVGGKQLLIWGQADGLNPTNNLIAEDLTKPSLRDEDKKLGNWMLNSSWEYETFLVEAVWIPIKQFNRLPVEGIPIPDGAYWESKDKTTHWKNSSHAVRLSHSLSWIDWSASWFHGYGKMTYLSSEVKDQKLELTLLPIRMHVFGMDFSSVMGDFGFRGEAAYSQPRHDEQRQYTPLRQIEYVFGVDRLWKDLHMILQYNGKTLLGTISETSSNPLLLKWNQLLYAQTKKQQHAVLYKASLELFHATWKLEWGQHIVYPGKEIYSQPMIVWNIHDALNLSFGAQWYYGRSNTLYGLMEERSNWLISDLRYSF